MENIFERTQMLIGSDNLNVLKKSVVAVFGIGGVGGYVAESLVRAGIGKILLIDNDKVSVSNINRQIIALHSTIDKYKVDVMENRIHDINPKCVVEKYKCFVLPDTIDNIDLNGCDYVVDAIDTISGKIAIIKKCKTQNIKVISSMGTGNKVDPSAFKITDIFSTKICPLAKVMRKLLKQNNISDLKVLYSIETPSPKSDNNSNLSPDTPSSISFVPSVAGLMIGAEVVKDLTGFIGQGKNFS